MANYVVRPREDGYVLMPQFFKDDLTPKEQELHQEATDAWGDGSGNIVANGPGLEVNEKIPVTEVFDRLGNKVIFEGTGSQMIFHSHFHNLSSEEEEMWEVLEELFPDHEIPAELAEEFEHNEQVALATFFDRTVEFYQQIVGSLLS